jgi:hypothetical protein
MVHVSNNFMIRVVITALITISLNGYANDVNTIWSVNKKLSDTTVLAQILALPLCSYIGKPVDSLLSVLPSGYSLRGFMVTRFGYSKGVIQGYGTTEANNFAVEIYIDHFQFQSFPNYHKSTWNINLAKLETISYIRIMKNNYNVCVYGCNNPQYYY